MQLLGSLCLKIGRPFKLQAKQCYPLVVDRLKDGNRSLSGQATVTLRHFLTALQLDDVRDHLVQGFQEKNTAIRIHSIQFVLWFLEGSAPPQTMLQQSAFVHKHLGLLRQDARQEVRDKSTALAQALEALEQPPEEEVAFGKIVKNTLSTYNSVVMNTGQEFNQGFPQEQM